MSQHNRTDLASDVVFQGEEPIKISYDTGTLPPVDPGGTPITCAGASNSIKMHFYISKLQPGEEHVPVMEQVKVNDVLQTEPPAWLTQTPIPAPSFPAPEGFDYLASFLMTNTSSQDKRVEHLFTPEDVAKVQQRIIFEDNPTAINELALNGRVGYCLAKQANIISCVDATDTSGCIGLVGKWDIEVEGTVIGSNLDANGIKNTLNATGDFEVTNCSTAQCHVFNEGELDYLKNKSTGVTTQYNASFPIGDNAISINGNAIETSTGSNGELVLGYNPYVELSYIGNNYSQPGFYKKADVNERIVLQICSSEPVQGSTPFWGMVDDGMLGVYTSRKDSSGYETAIFVFNTQEDPPIVISCDGATDYLDMHEYVRIASDGLIPQTGSVIKLNGVVTEEPPANQIEIKQIPQSTSIVPPAGYQWSNSFRYTNLTEWDMRIEMQSIPANANMFIAKFEGNPTINDEQTTKGRISWCMSPKGETPVQPISCTGATSKIALDVQFYYNPVGDVSSSFMIKDASNGEWIADAQVQMFYPGTSFAEFLNNNMNSAYSGKLSFEDIALPVIDEADKLVLFPLRIISKVEDLRLDITHETPSNAGVDKSVTSLVVPDDVQNTTTFVWQKQDFGAGLFQLGVCLSYKAYTISCAGASTVQNFQSFGGLWDVEVDGIFGKASANSAPVQNYLEANYGDRMYANYDGFMYMGTTSSRDVRLRLIPVLDPVYTNPNGNDTFAVQDDGSLTFCLKGQPISCAGAKTNMVLVPTLEFNGIIYWTLEFDGQVYDLGKPNGTEIIGAIPQAIKDHIIVDWDDAFIMVNQDVGIPHRIKFTPNTKPSANPVQGWSNNETLLIDEDGTVSFCLSGVCEPNTTVLANDTLGGAGGEYFLRCRVTAENFNIDSENFEVMRVDNPASTTMEEILSTWVTEITGMYDFLHISKSATGGGNNFYLKYNETGGELTSFDLIGYSDQFGKSPITIEFVRTNEPGDVFAKLFPTATGDSVVAHSCGTSEIS